MIKIKSANHRPSPSQQGQRHMTRPLDNSEDGKVTGLNTKTEFERDTEI